MSYIFEKKKLENYLGKYLLQTLKEYKAFVAGGVITSLFCNRDINDVDIYFRTKEDAGDFISEMIENREWIISHTNKATAFKYSDKILQAIHFDYFKTPEEIFNKFDFTVCMGVYDCFKEDFVLHEDFLKHNAQRILKFNENTAYPIISALRVQKYEDKHYKISKPEYIKILLTCMNLKIDNYEDLKEQMGGMYGVNYDKLLKPEEGEEFNISKIISKLSDLVIDESYFKAPDTTCFNMPENIEDLAYQISGRKIKIIKFKDTNYTYKFGEFDSIYENFDNNDIYEKTELSEILHAGSKLYKFVKKVGEQYFSFNDSKFEYKIGEVVIPNNPSNSASGIYCGFFKSCYDFTHQNAKDAVLIELELLDINDIKDLCSLRLNKAKIIREVPKEEYEQYLK